jgi:transposase
MVGRRVVDGVQCAGRAPRAATNFSCNERFEKFVAARGHCIVVSLEIATNLRIKHLRVGASSFGDAQNKNPQKPSNTIVNMPSRGALATEDLRALDVPGGNLVLAAVRQSHTSEDVVLHGLYGFYFNERSVSYLAKEFGKHRSTVWRWVKKWERHRVAGRHSRSARSIKYTTKHRLWILRQYKLFPLTYIDEACFAFYSQFSMAISPSYLWNLLSEAGLTWKVQ